MAKQAPISIKPGNEGKFTAQAKAAGKTVQQMATDVLKEGSKASPTTVKRAVFAKNAAKWNKK